jgi:hypothetical protein
VCVQAQGGTQREPVARQREQPARFLAGVRRRRIRGSSGRGGRGDARRRTRAAWSGEARLRDGALHVGDVREQALLSARAAVRTRGELLQPLHGRVHLAGECERGIRLRALCGQHFALRRTGLRELRIQPRDLRAQLLRARIHPRRHALVAEAVVRRSGRVARDPGRLLLADQGRRGAPEAEREPYLRQPQLVQAFARQHVVRQRRVGGQAAESVVPVDDVAQVVAHVVGGEPERVRRRGRRSGRRVGRARGLPALGEGQGEGAQQREEQGPRTDDGHRGTHSGGEELHVMICAPVSSGEVDAAVRAVADVVFHGHP